MFSLFDTIGNCEVNAKKSIPEGGLVGKGASPPGYLLPGIFGGIPLSHGTPVWHRPQP